MYKNHTPTSISGGDFDAVSDASILAYKSRTSGQSNSTEHDWASCSGPLLTPNEWKKLGAEMRLVAALRDHEVSHKRLPGRNELKRLVKAGTNLASDMLAYFSAFYAPYKKSKNNRIKKNSITAPLLSKPHNNFTLIDSLKVDNACAILERSCKYVWMATYGINTNHTSVLMLFRNTAQYLSKAVNWFCHLFKTKHVVARLERGHHGSFHLHIVIGTDVEIFDQRYISIIRRIILAISPAEFLFAGFPPRIDIAPGKHDSVYDLRYLAKNMQIARVYQDEKVIYPECHYMLSDHLARQVALDVLDLRVASTYARSELLDFFSSIDTTPEKHITQHRAAPYAYTGVVQQSTLKQEFKSWQSKPGQKNQSIHLLYFLTSGKLLLRHQKQKDSQSSPCSI